MSKLAVIKTGGKQYKVSEGSKLKIEKLSSLKGGDVQFKEVLLYIDGKTADIGTPVLKSVRVSGRVLGEGKREKVIIFKYKKRKRTSTKKGHRQPYVEVEITSIKKETSAVKKSAVKKTTTKKAS
ncbi:MAG: 50S ribosomal protein L21 [Candidatus Spechtbacteria bacterium]|nr:50S ribosomal protein L21 [Candidatus Spechtbacteria bacterium]